MRMEKLSDAHFETKLILKKCITAVNQYTAACKICLLPSKVSQPAY